MPSCHSKDDEKVVKVVRSSSHGVSIPKRKHSLRPPTTLPDGMPDKPATRVMPSRNTRNSNPDYGTVKPKARKTGAADKYTLCEFCGEWTCDGVSDGCNKYYHKQC